MMLRIGSMPALILLFLLISCRSNRPVTTPPPLQAEREFRAAWVATVANINWPSKPGLPVDSQKKEALLLLDFLQAQHFNAVVFQVRPQADALYASSLEPWSYFLTGTQGRAPEPYYDPLQFWIDAAHDRGMELHVWLNPYRAHHPTGGPVTDSSIVLRKPGLVLHLKQGYWWFDPSLPETREHATQVVMDIVRRYDIDGVHFDDYFYPYREYNKGEDFPDSVSWAGYRAQGGKLDRNDWRRHSVNNFISGLYNRIKKEKKQVKFGLSPFGIWRPGYPEGICCFDQYDVLYADARLWLNKGWIDYFSPQLYWPISRMNTSFPLLLGWWAGENKKQRHLWPGISVGDTSQRSATEVLNQVMVTRGMLPRSKGVIHWSIGQVFRSAQLQKGLLAGPYKNDALVPATPWLDKKAPRMPTLTGSQRIGDSLISFSWKHPEEKDVFRWVVYYAYGQTKRYKILNRNERSVQLPLAIPMSGDARQGLTAVAITAVDRMGNESGREEASGQW